MEEVLGKAGTGDNNCGCGGRDGSLGDDDGNDDSGVRGSVSGNDGGDNDKDGGSSDKESASSGDNNNNWSCSGNCHCNNNGGYSDEASVFLYTKKERQTLDELGFKNTLFKVTINFDKNYWAGIVRGVFRENKTKCKTPIIDKY